ncbi:MAG: hypothetical protein AB1705_07440 [Verrucomicrobiota bacterium]
MKGAAEEVRKYQATQGKDMLQKENYEEAIRSVAGYFPEVPVHETSGNRQFVKVQMNRLGAGLDGIRFKVPGADSREMVWVFALPRTNSLHSWYIVSKDGPMNGFKRFIDSHGAGGAPYDEMAPWGRLKEEHRSFIQPLTGGELKGGREYIVWFKFKDQTPTELYVAINLLPAGTKLTSVIDWEKALGFVWE